LIVAATELIEAALFLFGFLFQEETAEEEVGDVVEVVEFERVSLLEVLREGGKLSLVGLLLFMLSYIFRLIIRFKESVIAYLI